MDGESAAEAQARREAYRQSKLETLSEDTLRVFEVFPDLKAHYLGLQVSVMGSGSGDNYISLFKKLFAELPDDFGTSEQAVAILNDMVRRLEELSDEQWEDEDIAGEKETRISKMSPGAQKAVKENPLLMREIFTDPDMSSLREEAEWLAAQGGFVEKYGGSDKWKKIISEIEKNVGELE